MMETLIRQTNASLNQLEQLLELLGNDDYGQPVPLLSGATIGQHTRHVIEFFRELNAGYASGIVNYDARKRDPETETSRAKAIAQIRSLKGTLYKKDRIMTLVSGLTNDSNGGTVRIRTNYARELQYNLEHTVHHMALLRIAVSLLTSIELPENFGVAEATIQYRKACAQ